MSEIEGGARVAATEDRSTAIEPESAFDRGAFGRMATVAAFGEHRANPPLEEFPLSSRVAAILGPAQRRIFRGSRGSRGSRGRLRWRGRQGLRRRRRRLGEAGHLQIAERSTRVPRRDADRPDGLLFPPNRESLVGGHHVDNSLIVDPSLDPLRLDPQPNPIPAAVFERDVVGGFVFDRRVIVDVAESGRASAPTAEDQGAVAFVDRESQAKEEVIAVKPLGFASEFVVLPGSGSRPGDRGAGFARIQDHSAVAPLNPPVLAEKMTVDDSPASQVAAVETRPIVGAGLGVAGRRLADADEQQR